VKYWEIIADNLSKAGWSWGCVATVDRERRTIWVVAAERDAQRFIVHADEKLTAFVELDSEIVRQKSSTASTNKKQKTKGKSSLPRGCGFQH
jgi:hypothetical protein